MQKKILLSVIILVFSLGCSSDKKEQKSKEVLFSEDNTTTPPGEERLELKEKDFPQEWKLVKTSTMMVNSETTGDGMLYQEGYKFEFGNTFTKTRKQENTSLEASGSFYKIKNENGEEFFKLTYINDNDLIENCSGNKEEYLIIESEKTIRGTASACDHPSKVYEKQKSGSL